MTSGHFGFNLHVVDLRYLAIREYVIDLRDLAICERWQHSCYQGCQIGPGLPPNLSTKCFPMFFYFTVSTLFKHRSAQIKTLVLVSCLSCSFGIKSLSYFVTGNPRNLATLVVMATSNNRQGTERISYTHQTLKHHSAPAKTQLVSY